MKYYKLGISFLVLILLGCRDVVVNVPEQPIDPPIAISGTWSGSFGDYDERGERTTNESLVRRKDRIRLSIGETADRYSIHGVWNIAVYSYIEGGFTDADYPFSASLVDVGGGVYSARLYVNQGSAVYEMWLDNDRLIVYRPDAGYTDVLTRVTIPTQSAKYQ